MNMLTRRAGLALRTLIASVLILGGLSAALVSPASARVEAPTAKTYYFGAIAVASDGAAGWSYDYPARAGAIGRAVRECRARSNYPGTCRGIVWVRNGCAAVSLLWRNGSIANVGWGVAYTRARAVAISRNKAGYGSRLAASVCTTR